MRGAGGEPQTCGMLRNWPKREATKVFLRAACAPHQSPRERETTTTTLDALLQAFAVQHVDLMSCDCEGCETAALKGLDLSRTSVLGCHWVSTRSLGDMSGVSLVEHPSAQAPIRMKCLRKK